ncbi:hypothetical protein D7V77_00590 [Corallococcus sp. CA041A]|nr:hypothetical protein D7V77_00590 [Corallococcus sp. CA041A]
MMMPWIFRPHSSCFARKEIKLVHWIQFVVPFWDAIRLEAIVACMGGSIALIIVLISSATAFILARAAVASL